jgi:acyl-CoA thioesterase 11
MEEKRFHLAGRRRAIRKTMPPPSHTVGDFRAEILAMTSPTAQESRTRKQYEQLKSIQVELIADAYASNDPTIHSDGEYLVGDSKVYGNNPPRALLSEVRELIETWQAKRSSIHRHIGTELRPINEQTMKWDTSNRAPTPESRLFRGDDTKIRIEDTYASTLQIIMPQHANTVRVLFGGNLMGKYFRHDTLKMEIYTHL